MTDPLVSTTWLAERLSAPDVVIVDGSWYLPTEQRDALAEYRAAHIPGAVHFDIDSIKDTQTSLPHMLPRPDVFAAAVGRLGIGDGSRIVIYDGAGLFAAARAWWMFRTFGARDVAVLDGGLPKWIAEGNPVDDRVVTRLPRTFTPRLDHGAVADMRDVKRALADGVSQVVDARPAARFAGKAPEPRPGVPSGHMPGSYNLPFQTLLDQGRLKPPEAIVAAFRAAGIDPDAPVITSCGSGVTAAILTLALETAGKPAKALYDGSWAEWGSQPDAPIEKSE